MRDLPYISQAKLADHLNGELMFTFFAAFSRFEYALKAGGFCTQSGDAEPDWSRFVQAIDTPFRMRRETDTALDAAVLALAADPPMKQRADLTWTNALPQGPGDRTDNVMVFVRRVRNNLFHGGKAKRQRQDAERDNRLVELSLVVLDGALGCHDGVRSRFVEV